MFKKSRKFFLEFKDTFEHDKVLKEEFEKALSKLITLYNTTIYENRFIVGGAAEYIFVAALNGTGLFSAQHIGKVSNRFDIEMAPKDNPGEKAFYSIKSSFTKSGDIRMVNVLGESRATKWDEPTIFILANLGIAYSDYTILGKDTKRHRDALVLKRKSLTKFIKSNPKFLINASIPLKKQSVGKSRSRTASEDVARKFLQGYTKLRF